MWWNEQHCGLECGDPLRGHCWNRQDGERHWQVCPGPLCGWNCGATSDTKHSLYAHQHLPFRPCWQVSPPAVTALILAFRCIDCKLRQTMSPVSGHFKSVKGIQISIKNKIKLTCDRTSRRNKKQRNTYEVYVFNVYVLRTVFLFVARTEKTSLSPKYSSLLLPLPLTGKPFGQSFTLMQVILCIRVERSFLSSMFCCSKSNWRLHTVIISLSLLILSKCLMPSFIQILTIMSVQKIVKRNYRHLAEAQTALNYIWQVCQSWRQECKWAVPPLSATLLAASLTIVWTSKQNHRRTCKR